MRSFIRKHFGLSFKLLVLILLAWVVYKQVFMREEWRLIFQEFQVQKSYFKWELLIVVCLLMPINWALETWKWRILLQPKAPFFTSFKGVMTGLTLSLFTPHKIGDYGGRLFFVAPAQQWRATAATFVAGIAQWVVLITAGVLGFLFIYFNNLESQLYTFYSSLVIGLLLISISLLIYFQNFNISLFIRRVFIRLNMGKKWIEQIELKRGFNHGALWGTLGVAALRYGTYSLQYWLCLMAYGFDVPIEAAFAGISTIYLIRAGIPLPPILGVVAKGELALLIWSAYPVNPISILLATFIIFIINLIIPSLLGMFYLTKINVLKSLGYEKQHI